jgi:hypothetical protein
MSRRERRLSLVALLLPFVLVPAAATATPGARYRLGLDIAYGSPAGPERTLDRLIEDTLTRLAGSPCFSAVQRVPSAEPVDLLLSVRLDHFEDVTHHEASISERVSPNANPIDMASRIVATVSALTRIELRIAPEPGTVVRDRRFLAAESWRPRGGEDPRVAAEDGFVEKVSEAIEALACRGGAEKLGRAVDKARAAR